MISPLPDSPLTRAAPTDPPRARILQARQRCLACDLPAAVDTAVARGFGEEHPVLRCTRCGTRSLGVELDLAAWYEDAYWEAHHRGRGHSRWFEWYDRLCHRWIAGTRLRYFRERAPWRIAGRRVLDVGCGRGDTLEYLERHGLLCDGLEPDHQYVRRVRKRLRKGTCYEGTLDRAQLPAAYDLVCASHVLEHVADPVDFLKRLAGLTTPQGCVYIEVPNCEHPGVLEDSLRDHPHTLHLTSLGLRALCGRAGLSVEDIAVFRQRNLPRERRAWRKLLAMPRILATGNLFERARDRASGEVLLAWVHR